MKITATEDRPSNMLCFLWDAPNLITLLGFMCSIGAISLAVQGQFEIAMALALWAVAADWIDGWVASRARRRAPAAGEVGAQLDSFADLVSSGVFPAILIAAMGEFHAVAIGLAMIIGAAGVLRLSFFNVFGATEDGRVLGLPIAHNVLALAMLLLLRPFGPPDLFFAGFATAATVLALANVGSFYWRREAESVIGWVLGFIILASGALIAAVL